MTNNIIEMIPKKEKQDLEKYDLHLSEQLSKLFSEVEDNGSKRNEEDDKKINELPHLFHNRNFI